MCVRHEGLSSALTGTGGNSSATGAKARSRSPANAHVPEPAVLHVDTGPSEAEAPLERGNGRKMLEMYSQIGFQNGFGFAVPLV